MRHNYHKINSSRVYLLHLFLYVMLIFFAGCGKETSQTYDLVTPTIVESTFPEGQKLQLQVTPGNQYGAYDINLLEKGSIPHTNAVSEVHIFIDGQFIDLGTAIEDKKITVEEMDAYAKIDSKNGFCRMECASLNGFSLYVYHYDGYDIASYYDIFEAPDGSKEHFQKFCIATGNYYTDVTESSVDYPYYPRENWGVAFHVLEVTPDHIKLEITQSGGQQFGDLYIGPSLNIRKSKEQYYSTEGLIVQKKYSHITNDAKTEVVIQWPQGCPDFSSGEYSLSIRLEDHFDSQKIHPFTRDYSDHQYYEIDFIIP